MRFFKLLPLIVAFPLLVCAQDSIDSPEGLNQACNQNDYESCYVLGTLYSYGDGVPQDNFVASRLIIKACEGEVYDACFTIGEMYRTGDKVPLNSTQGKEYMTMAWQRAPEKAWIWLLSITKKPVREMILLDVISWVLCMKKPLVY